MDLPEGAIQIMTEEQLESLIQKYADGMASEEDVRQLMHWYRTSSINDVYWQSEQADEKRLLKDRMLKRLQASVRARRVDSFSWRRIAAILFVIITGVALSFYFVQTGKSRFA